MKQLYGVIGNPIGHSLSPVMHNDAFEHLNMDAHYHAFLVEEELLGDYLSQKNARRHFF